ncbi:hypothetical protein BGX26_004621, partial [Mortierella sp. AD094]
SQPHLEEMEVETPLVDMTLVRRVEVDILSLYFSYIRAVHMRVVYKAFRGAAEVEPNVLSDELAKIQLVNALHKKSLETFTQDPATVFHFDGLLNTQKAKAREARRNRISKNVTTMNDLSQKINDIVLTTDDQTPGPKARKRRLLRLNQQAKRQSSSARIIDSATKDSLATGLEELGWQVCRYIGESDVCIGRKAERNPGQIVAASTDSDLLFYWLKALLRKDTRNHTFTEYSIEKLTQRLGISQD